jgi:hypothetical protein
MGMMEILLSIFQVSLRNDGLIAWATGGFKARSGELCSGLRPENAPPKGA